MTAFFKKNFVKNSSDTKKSEYFKYEREKYMKIEKKSLKIFTFLGGSGKINARGEYYVDSI